uniref:PEP-CTERM sorting domain-containing protein n=1 Tax=Neptunicella sp. TaxID=2125986 RepID=UPI003F68ECDB
SIDGSSWSSIVGQGWQSIGQYADVTTTQYQSVGGGVTSKYWLIGAYNPEFGTLFNNGYGNDGFKLTSVTTTTREGNTTDVPEPGVMALFALGLLSLTRVRKKQQS